MFWHGQQLRNMSELSQSVIAKRPKVCSKACLTAHYGVEAGAVGCPVLSPHGAVPVCPCDAADHLVQQKCVVTVISLLLRE